VYTKVARPTLWLIKSEDPPSFYLSKTVITNEHWTAFDPKHVPALVSPGQNHPVVNVSFERALAYCAWYSELSNKSFRLPTEEEWSAACGGDAWHVGLEPSNQAREVERAKAGPLGIHDMLGGVREWTMSAYDPLSPGLRVIRGCSYRSAPKEQSAARREGAREGYFADDLGFRIARSLG
jgi:formylglycine-generating enzyme required for sulfatase activity